MPSTFGPAQRLQPVPNRGLHELLLAHRDLNRRDLALLNHGIDDLQLFDQIFDLEEQILRRNPEIYVELVSGLAKEVMPDFHLQGEVSSSCLLCMRQQRVTPQAA